MVTGHLEQRRGYWHVSLNLRDENGKRKRKMITTHLPVKGNKKRAEEILTELRIKHTTLEDIRHNSRGIFFYEYMASWIATMERKVAPSTYNGYKNIVLGSICPYFQELSITLNDLKATHIKGYYDSLHQRGVSNSTILRHHNNIRKALQEAYLGDLIPYNPADRVERLRADDYISHPYTIEEANQLIKAIKGEKLELVILIALFYGLRRSEILGMRWNVVDFTNDTIIINHTLTQVQVDGKYSVIARDKVKRTSSFRTLPLVSGIKDRLLLEKDIRNPKGDDYICVDEKGTVIKPNYVSLEFPKLLKRHDLRSIRFHDLRHSCANLLISQRVPLIEVQQWLGHSAISTTANLYAHLDFSTKQNCANTIKKI